jgi:hypothetical protein
MSEENQNIFGYTFEQIQRAQQGGRLNDTIDLSKVSKKPPTEADYKMLEKYGEQGLREMQYFGVMDRLGIPFNL